MSSFFILVARNWLRSGGVDVKVWKQVWHGQRRWQIRGAVRMTNSSGQQVSLWGVNNRPGVKAAI